MSIQIENLSLSYDQCPAVHHLNATIENGEWLAIVGPNGAGKSTLLNAIAGLTWAKEGSILGIKPDTVSLLPQQTQLDKHFPMTLFELVSTGLWRKLGYAGSMGHSEHQQCEEAIQAVGLQGLEHRMINSLSGGQLQRSLFARILVEDQPVILLDEPFNAIDSKTLSDMTNLIKEWHQEKRTIIMVSHDLEYVKQHCPKTLVLARKCIGHGSTREVLTEKNMNQARSLSDTFDQNLDWIRQGAA